VARPALLYCRRVAARIDLALRRISHRDLRSAGGHLFPLSSISDQRDAVSCFAECFRVHLQFAGKNQSLSTVGLGMRGHRCYFGVAKTAV
jgi:hypothetical protein